MSTHPDHKDPFPHHQGANPPGTQHPRNQTRATQRLPAPVIRIHTVPRHGHREAVTLPRRDQAEAVAVLLAEAAVAHQAEEVAAADNLT